MSTFSLDDLARLLRTLPPNPVAPENRRIARLCPSAYVPRGQMYRLAAQPEFTGHNRPMIVLNTEDLKALRELWTSGPCGWFPDIDQEIADIAEQLFALQEAKRGR